MVYLKWLVLVPYMLAITVLTYLFSPVLPFFAIEREGNLDNNTRYGLGRYLPSWLSIFQTPDNSLEGDGGWRTEHWQWRFKLPEFLATYIGRIGWLCRNPGYGVGLVVFDSGAEITVEYSGNKLVNDSPGVEGYCLVHAGGLFQFVWIKRISKSKCFYCNFGWNIKGLIDAPRGPYTATFAFSPRVATWRE